MEILITGATGMLGKAIVDRFKNHKLILTSSQERDGYVLLDITNQEQVQKVLNTYKPDIIINCAAYTDVNKAEEEYKNVYNLNALGPQYLAEWAKQWDATLVHISTDYVFNGLKDLDSFYTEEDIPSPLNIYGKTKRLGEKNIINSGVNHYIFRTSWLFGDGKNFVRTIINAARMDYEIPVVDDQYGSPTYTEDLANIIYEAVIDKEIPFGIYHATNLGFLSWYDFAKDFLDMLLVGYKLEPISSRDYPSRAIRPKNSHLSKNKLASYGIEIPTYYNALCRYIEKEYKYE